MRSNYNISEIFYSIQGEGAWTGAPSIFIRFAGCNLNCPWCDTNHISRRVLSLAGLLSNIAPYKSRRVILTGGEPALQVCEEMVAAFKHEGYIVHIETNGTLIVPRNIDWITVSPKTDWQEAEFAQNTGNELKLVYTGQTIERLIHLEETTSFDHYFLQPEHKSNRVKEAVELCKQRPVWRLGLQAHKLIGLD